MYKLKIKDKEYSVKYSINRYIDTKERIEHVLTLGRVEFKGKSLDDCIDKLKKRLEC